MAFVMIARVRAVVCAWLLVLAMGVPMAALADDSDKVRAFADQLAQRALIIVKNDGMSADTKQEQLASLFRAHVDIPWVARFVLGKYWRTADDNQRNDYLKSYEAFLLKNYSSKLTNYTGQEYEIKQVRNGDEAGEYRLTMELINKGEPNVLIDYRIRKHKNDYRIFDIIIEGVSLITTQRSEFGSVISQKGMDFLINALMKRAGLA